MIRVQYPSAGWWSPSGFVKTEKGILWMEMASQRLQWGMF